MTEAHYTIVKVETINVLEVEWKLVLESMTSHFRTTTATAHQQRSCFNLLPRQLVIVWKLILTHLCINCLQRTVAKLPWFYWWMQKVVGNDAKQALLCLKWLVKEITKVFICHHSFHLKINWFWSKSPAKSTKKFPNLVWQMTPFFVSCWSCSKIGFYRKKIKKIRKLLPYLQTKVPVKFSLKSLHKLKRPRYTMMMIIVQ